MIDITIGQATWRLRSPFSPKTQREIGTTVTYDDRPRAPLTQALVNLADHVVNWRGVLQDGKEVPCTLDLVVAILRSDGAVKQEVETALRDYTRSGMLNN